MCTLWTTGNGGAYNVSLHEVSSREMDSLQRNHMELDIREMLRRKTGIVGCRATFRFLESAGVIRRNQYSRYAPQSSPEGGSNAPKSCLPTAIKQKKKRIWWQEVGR